MSTIMWMTASVPREKLQEAVYHLKGERKFLGTLNLSFSATARCLPTIGFLSSRTRSRGNTPRFGNDNEAVEQFMTQEPLLAGFNNKHYDQFILNAVLSGFTPEEIKAVNDFIIVGGHEGWEYAPLRDCADFLRPIRSDGRLPDGFVPESNRKRTSEWTFVKPPFRSTSNRPLTEDEKREVEFYCRHDVDATDRLDDLRQGYLSK